MDDIQKHVRVYLVVFSALMVLTILTVAVSYLHLSVMHAVVLALSIAFVKGSLVALFFMHLISERRVIYTLLIFTFLFFVALMILPAFESQDVIGAALK